MTDDHQCFAERERFSNGRVEWCVFSGSSVICFYFYSRKFLFLLSKNIIFSFLFLLSKLKIRISNFSFYSRNSRSESHISPSTLEIRDQILKFLFLLSKFEIRTSNFSFYSQNLRSKFKISLSTLKFTFLTLVNAWFTHLGKLSQIKPFFPLFWHYSGQASRASFMRWVDKTTFRIFCAAAPDLTSPQARSHLNFRIDSLQVFQWSTKMDKSCVGAEVLNYCCSKWKESTSAISDQICFKPLA